jgi:hypothetical protein
MSVMQTPSPRPRSDRRSLILWLATNSSGVPRAQARRLVALGLIVGLSLGLLQRQSWRVVPHIHPILQRRFPEALWAGSGERPDIALTFDDGPGRYDTPALLEVLARHGALATFFWLGELVQALPPLAHMAAAAGHQIAIHGYGHRAFPLLPANMLLDQLNRKESLSDPGFFGKI